jgi:hypothetical protein
MFMPGSVFFGGATFFQAATVTGAFNGTSLNGTNVQLGQIVGTVGDPAGLIGDVEIPDNGHTVFFGENDGVSDVVGISANNGISISNAAGQGLLIFNFGLNFNILTPDAAHIAMQWGSPASQFLFTNATTVITYNGSAFIVNGLGVGNRSTVAAVVNVTANDSVILVSAAAGNVVVNVNPVTLTNQIFHIKKTDATVNTVTITPSSGTIQELGAPAASFAFNSQGQSVTIYSNGVNFFVL